MKDTELTLDQLSLQVHDFLKTDLGKHIIKHLLNVYNDRHQKAETEGLTNAQVAALINESKGWKGAFDWFMSMESTFQHREK